MPARRVLISISIAVLAVCLIAYFAFAASAPGIAEVKNHMASEQRLLGDPIVNSIGMVLVPIPSGEFQMGTPSPKPDPKNPKKKPQKNGPDMPQHLVKITRPFYFGVCEVTQQQYEAVMGERPWEGKPLVEVGPNYAASYITWEKATEFCKKLSDTEAVRYRLPTEAEWEYACRAGTQTTYSFGDDSGQLADHAWFDENAYKQDKQYAHHVGQRSPNAWSLFDMHGNVWEWCEDRFGPYTDQEATDPQGPQKGRHRVWRGGSFADARVNTRSATRVSYGRRDYHPEYLPKVLIRRRDSSRKRMQFLAQFFAVDVMAFAVLSNHFHCVLRNRPDLVKEWSDEEVARRWLHIFPLRRNKDQSVPKPTDLEIQMLVGDSEKLAELRRRLSSISWMMRCLGEVIARQANKDDEVTGHFWEGRFKSQPLLDESAVLACMAYVDLNPVRAGIAQTAETSEHTSAYERIKACQQRETDLDTLGRRKGFSPYRWTPDCWLSPIELAQEVADETTHRAIYRASHKGCLPISLAEYLRILDWTGRQISSGKGAIPSDIAPILERLGLMSEGWVTMVTEFGRLFRQSAGRPTSLKSDAMRRSRTRVHSIKQTQSHFA